MRTVLILFLLCIFCLGPVAIARPRLRKGKRDHNGKGRAANQLVRNRKHHKCFSDGKHILPRFVCDGIFHCSDLSDEYLCRLKEKNSEELETGFKTLENLIFRNSSTAPNPFRDLLKFMRQKQADYDSETAIEVSYRACIPGLRRKKNQQSVDPCLYCKPGQILCSNTPAANLSKVNWMMGTSYKTCVEKSEICDKRVQCFRGQDEAFCALNTPANSVHRNDSNDVILGSGDDADQQGEESYATSTEATSLSPAQVKKKTMKGKKKNSTTAKREQNSKSNPTITCKMITDILSLVKKMGIDRQRHRHEVTKRIFENPFGILGLPIKYNHTSPTPWTGLGSNFRQPNLESQPPNYSTPNTSFNGFEEFQFQSNVTTLTFNQICDEIIDCPTKADEMMCPGRFYCKSGSPLYVNEFYALDDREDCEDGSDEWLPNDGKPSMSSKDKMVKDWPMVLVMWMIGVVAIVGNGIVITKAFLTLCVTAKSSIFGDLLSRISKEYSGEPDSETSRSKRTFVSTSSLGPLGRKRMIQRWNGGLVLNLAFADILMGIYLVTLAGISSGRYMKYWTFDKKWRTSAGCQCLGFIVTLSSQASVFSLLSLTTLRLFTLVKPLSQTLFKTRYLLLTCSVIWLASATLASVPLLPGLKYYYVTNAWIPTPHFKPPVVEKIEAENLVIRLADLTNTTKLLPYTGEQSLTWPNMIEYTKTVAPVISEWRLFGYYGAHSVCTPTLFVTTSDVSWQHTAVFLGVNFISVIYICVSYSVIYFKSTSGRDVVRRDSNVVPNLPPNSSNNVGNKPGGSHRPVGLIRCLCNFRQKEDEPTTVENNTEEMAYSSEYQTKTKELKSMQFRIALLVGTDCLCWLPICIMGFLKLGNVAIPDIAYSISAVGLLPINSALNPLLYSRFVHAVGLKIWTILKKPLNKESRSSHEE